MPWDIKSKSILKKSIPTNLFRPLLKKLKVIKPTNDNIPKKSFFRVDKLEFFVKEIVNANNKTIPTKGLTKENKIEEINKMYILDLIFINA